MRVPSTALTLVPDQPLAGQEAEPVARSHGLRRFEYERARIDAHDPSDPLTDGLRRIERRHAGTFAREEIGRFPAREALRRVGCEIGDALARRGAVQLRPRGQRRVHRLPVIGHDVADVVRILEPPLDLERPHPGIKQLAQMG